MRAGLTVTERFFPRAGLLDATARPARGILDELSQYGRGAQGLEHVADSVRSFFVRTAELALTIEPSWRWWARWYGAAWHAVSGLVGQLCIPVKRAEIETVLFALRSQIAGRVSARGVWRRYASSEKTMQVIVYSVLERAGEGYMSASFPLPGAVLEGVLRLECVGTEGEHGTWGARLTSDRRADVPDDPVGVFLHTRWGRVRLPLGESLTLWDARSKGAPSELTGDAMVAGSSLVAIHEQRLFGRVMVRHRYWFQPVK